MATDNLLDLARGLRQLLERTTRENAVLFVDLLNNQSELIPS